ncbi:hypothetical protein [Chromobacterium violaceum]
MASGVKCPVCGGESQVSKRDGSMQFLTCLSCKYEFAVRAHYTEDSILLETKVFKALVDVNDPSMVRKLRVKVKKVFEGKSNFYQEDLDRQINQGAKYWDLGFYSDQEIEELLKKAVEFGLEVNFIPS